MIGWNDLTEEGKFTVCMALLIVEAFLLFGIMA